MCGKNPTDNKYEGGILKITHVRGNPTDNTGAEGILQITHVREEFYR